MAAHLGAERMCVPVFRTPMEFWADTMRDMITGHLSMRSHIESLRNTHTEHVFCLPDPLLSLAEIGLLPSSLRRSICGGA